MTRTKYPPARKPRSPCSCCSCGCFLPLLLVVLVLGGTALFLYWPSRTYISGTTPLPQDLQLDSLHLDCHHLPVTTEEPNEAPFLQVSHRGTGDIWFVLDLNSEFTWFQPDVMLQDTVTVLQNNPNLQLNTPIDPAFLVSLFQAIPVSRLFTLLPHLPLMQTCDPATLSRIRESYATGAAFLAWGDGFRRNVPVLPTPPAESHTAPDQAPATITPGTDPEIQAVPTRRLSEVGFANVNANIRSGPGTRYAIVGSAPQGTQLLITGQNEDGSWLQLDSGHWIYAPLVDPTPPRIAATPVPTLPPPTPPSPATATPLPVATPTVSSPQSQVLQAPTVTALPDTALLYARALDQINGVRTQQGLSPVTMGLNSAAQDQAEELHRAQYLSHWDQEGLTPYMRYTRAGGQGYSAENVSFIGRLTDQKCTPHNLDDWQNQIFSGLMASPGHRDNILNPHHTTVNLGIVHSCYLLVMVQLFEGNYVEYTLVPQIRNGVLSLQGKTLHGTSLQNSLTLYWDPLPYALARDQLIYSSCYGVGVPVAIILTPLEDPNAFYVEEQTLIEQERCLSPYDVSVIRPFPDNPQALDDLFRQIKNRPRMQEAFVVPYYVADMLEADSSAFRIQADVASLLQRQGPGVYGIALSGYHDSNPNEPFLLSYYSIWYQ